VDNLAQVLAYILVGLLGAVVGSFMNVCIYRIPRSLSIIFPGSQCPNCKARIAYYDNIPILSYLLLKGKCRHCHTAISFRYPLVEAMNSIFYLLIFYKFGITYSTILGFLY